MSYDHSIRSHPFYQYQYSRSPLYCLMDRNTTEITSTGFWLDLDGAIDAPECLPTGSSNGSDKHGRRIYKDFVWREFGTEEHHRREALAKKLIDELLAELAEEEK